MTQRNYYRGEDGVYYLDDAHGTARRAHGYIVTPQEVADCARRWRSIGTSRVREQYIVATAERETDFAVNEVDVEPSGFTSRGIFQISSGVHFDGGTYVPGDDELRLVGLDWRGWDLLALDHSVQAFLTLQETRLARIMLELQLAAGSTPPEDVWAYLGIAHNEGLAAALKTLNAHGLDWTAYKARNGACARHVASQVDWDRACDPTSCSDYAKHIGRYGDAMITGGSRWSEVR